MARIRSRTRRTVLALGVVVLLTVVGTVGAGVVAASAAQQAPPDPDGDGDPATDPDGDGLYEDVNGDGTFDRVDVEVFAEVLESERSLARPDLFDFDQDGALDMDDLAALRSEYDSYVDVNGDGNTVSDVDGDGLYEDIDGDGSFTRDDVTLFRDNLASNEIQNRAEHFDFNNDGSLSALDADALEAELGPTPTVEAPTDGAEGDGAPSRGFLSNSGDEPEFLTNVFNLTMLGFLLSVLGIVYQMMEGG